MRNVYKSSSKIALAIKQAVAPFPKVLLTATPLQNSLLELYGPTSIIDDYAFGDLESYRARFARLSNDGTFAVLKERLSFICKRTLRRQVLEYVKYTNRLALVQEFVPTPDEQRLYDLLSDYLQRETHYALPASQRQLVTLILRKLLASSSFAISGTLEAMIGRLAAAAQGSPALQQKAVIFTESRRTQEYLFRLLEQTEFAGKVMLFNGTNNDPTSKAIYRRRLARRKTRAEDSRMVVGLYPIRILSSQRRWAK